MIIPKSDIRRARVCSIPTREVNANFVAFLMKFHLVLKKFFKNYITIHYPSFITHLLHPFIIKYSKKQFNWQIFFFPQLHCCWFANAQFCIFSQSIHSEHITPHHTPPDIHLQTATAKRNANFICNQCFSENNEQIYRYEFLYTGK